MSLILVALVLLLAGGLGWGALHLKRRLERSERDRRRAADELNRRLSELFSLQELSYILAGSLQLDRIVEQVVRYAMRFLDAQGALVALAAEGEGGRPLHVTAAEGTLAGLAGRAIAPTDSGLVVRSLSRERLELVRSSSGEPTRLLGDVAVDSAAAVSLRAHGVVVGTLVIANPRDRTFPPEDMRLLSTVATHAAIVIANARFFQMVQHAKEQWETAFDALSEGIAVVDDHGCIRRANRALAAMLGAPIPAVIGCDLGEALLGPSPALVELLVAAREGNRVQPVVLRSATRSIRVNAARIPASAPAPAHDHSVVVLVEDVTDQQALEAQLIQSEKLAAVGQLVSGVAHELNNPLTSIAGLSELLLEQQELGTKDRGHLRVIHEQADRAGRIVRNLLTFARKGPGEQAAVDLNDVIQRTLLLMSYDLDLKDITIEKNLAPLPPVLGDRHALQQVVINLLNNAAQAVAENPPERPRVILLTTWVDDRVRMRVTDSGAGIADVVLPNIFTPFFTTKEPGQGTGLGLSITYSIVDAHGGRITVERPTEGGAAFMVDLPLASIDAERHGTPEPQVVAPPPPAATRSILLVDEDPAVRRMVKALFGRDGHTVEVARNPQHALDLVRTRAFDLILVDSEARAQDHLFVEQLVESQPELKDRVLVARGDLPPAAEEELARLSLHYVRKPFNLRDLRDEAARVWAAHPSDASGAPA